MVQTANIFSVLGESKDASFHNFQHGLAASLCCNEKWQIQHSQFLSMIRKCTNFCWKTSFCSQDIDTKNQKKFALNDFQWGMASNNNNATDN